MNKEQGLSIISAEIKNFKNISARHIDFAGKSMIIAGKNEAGKSSIIQAIMSPLDSKYIPPKPIKNGESNAEIELEIEGELNGQYVKYTLACYFSQENQKGRVVLFDESGAKMSGGKAIIESLVGNIGFDIMSFIKKGKTDSGKPSQAGIREQIEILTQLMPMEGVTKLHELDMEYNEKYAERTSVNKEIDFLKAKLKHDFSQEELDVYETDRSEELAVKKASLTQISESVEKWNDASRKKADNLENLKVIPLDIAEYKNQIKELEAKIKQAEFDLKHEQERKVKIDNFFAKYPEKPSVQSLSEEIESLSNHQENRKKVLELYDIQKKSIAEQEKSETITERLKVIKKEKEEVFASYPLPVKGLTFDEEGISYDGLPLHDEQINTAKLIEIGLKIGMAMNPNLRVMIIKDGSLLDKETLNKIINIADKRGYYLLIEVVDSEQEDLELRFVESEVK
jgi:AAA15 family ATPase/GTPase